MIKLIRAKDLRPTLETERLLLRPFQMSDAADVRRLAGCEQITKQLSRMPNPSPRGQAEKWISGQKADYHTGKNLNFAITLKRTGELMGSIGLCPKEELLRAEVGYWVGVPYWSAGYATEALREMIRFGFDDFALQRIYAVHFATNLASGRVMEKAGMKLEGFMRLGATCAQGLCDSMQRAIIKPDWEREQED